MRPIQVTDVRAHPGDSAFLVDDGKTAILYDSGFAFTGCQVARNIRAALGERPLDYIFLTHSHYDHALGSVYALRDWPGAKVVASEYAARIFQKPSARAVMRDLDRKFALRNGIAEYEDLVDRLRVDIPVNDGDIIHAGDMHFTVIGLPGHTRCSIGFYEPTHRLLLSCETLGVFDGESAVVPSYLVGVQMALDSIAKAEALDIESILLPHLGLMDAQQTRIYLQNARKSAWETAQEIAALYRQGASHDDAVQYFKQKFYFGPVKAMYPPDALELNTSIMVDLIKKELVT